MKSKPNTLDAANPSHPRRVPVQGRARETVQKLLSHAERMVAEQGRVDLNLTELAQAAGVAIGTVYKYFPGQSAIVRALAEEHIERLRELLHAAVNRFQGAAGELNAADAEGRARLLEEMVHGVIDAYFTFYHEDPTFQIIWRGIQADPALRELDLEDSRRNAEFLADSFRMFSDLPPAKLRALALLLSDLSGSALRLTLDLSAREAREVTSHFKRMVAMYVIELFS